MSVGYFANNSFAQGNQTNQSAGGGQQNQSGIGTATQMENLTAGNMDQTGEAGQTAINQTGEQKTISIILVMSLQLIAHTVRSM